jgi:hypothetical protein
MDRHVFLFIRALLAAHGGHLMPHALEVGLANMPALHCAGASLEIASRGPRSPRRM